MLLIGVDVGMQPNNTGVATYRTENKQLNIWSGSLWEFIEWISAIKRNESNFDVVPKIGVVLEDPTLDRVTFQKGATQAISNKLSRDAGKNQGGAIIVKQMLKALSIPCVCIAPSKRKKASKHLKNVQALTMPTKTTKAQFKQLTGYSETKGNNEHSRDAATLVWGMTEAIFDKRLKFQK